VLVVPKREGKREEATSLRLVVPKVRTDLKDGSATGRAAYASTHTGNGVYVNPGDSGDRHRWKIVLQVKFLRKLEGHDNHIGTRERY
jgi:hypothetical protein